MKIEYENPWFKVVKDGKYHFLEEVGSDNGAVVLLLINGDFVFVSVNRPAHKAAFLEAPRGYGDVGETSEMSAVREVYEETGYKFDVTALENIGVVRPNTAILSSSIPVYLIESNLNLPSKAPDKEVDSLSFIPEAQIYKEIADGKITDGISLAALSLYWARNK